MRNSFQKPVLYFTILQLLRVSSEWICVES